MSQETAKWLHTKIMMGFVEKRGHAWHYRAGDADSEANHYTGPVPVADMSERLFNWEAVEVTGVTCEVPELTLDGVDSYKVEFPNRKYIVRPRGALSDDDPGQIFQVAGLDYLVHQHKRWLHGEVEFILDAGEAEGLGVGSAGLLKAGAIAFVQFELPDTIETKSGIQFRPQLLAAGSMDSSLSTTYKLVRTIVQCDNTMAGALGERSPQIKIRHTSRSAEKLSNVRDALELVYRDVDNFSAEVERLVGKKMTKAKFGEFLDIIAPMPAETNKYGVKVATDKREILEHLWTEDPRVAPWKGTAFGAIQMMNTFRHHSGKTTGDRFERNQMDAIKGDTDREDRAVYKILSDLGVA
jgi:phage/plasmid-like protein (TIGR03299 family)